MKLPSSWISLILIGFLANFALAKQKPDQEYLALTNATVINTNPDQIGKQAKIEKATVLIRGSKIVYVGPANQVDIPKHVKPKIIDLKGKFIIPGMIDGHIHFFQSGGLYTRPDALDLRSRYPYQDELKWIKDNIDDVFKRYIACGVTSVIDMGGPFWNFDVRKKSHDAQVAPRVFTTGPLIASYQPEALTTDDPPIIKVHSKKQALELVRKQLAQKPDLIKIWYVVSKDTGLEEFYPIVEAVAKETHAHQLPLYVHALELETAKKALQAGADVLVHSVIDQELDPEFLDLAAEKKAILIPTLWVFNSYAAVYTKQLKLMPIEYLKGNPQVISTFFDMYQLTDEQLGQRQKKLQQEMKPIEPSPIVLKNLKLMQDKGITLALGTDAGNVGVLHGPAIYHDFQIMAQAGLTNQQILTAATYNAAKLVGRQKDLGSIEAGKLADLVVLNHDPLADIHNTAKIDMVIKDGKIFDPKKILKPTPGDLAQMQLNAYNAKDIEAFLAVYHPQVEVFEYPDRLLYRGLDKIRQGYREFFNKAGSLHCRLVNRIQYKNVVIDREEVTTEIPGREHLEAIAIYEIEDDKIIRVRFVK
jgi:imidazolonepropionase-like amidohydrolase